MRQLRKRLELCLLVALLKNLDSVGEATLILYVQAGTVDEDPGCVGHVHQAGQGGTPAGLASHARHR